MKRSETKLSCPQGEFDLFRYPETTNQSLRAWDSADEYLLQEIDEKYEISGNIWILNAGFGALTTALSSHLIYSYSDSFVFHEAQKKNLFKNGAKEELFNPVKSTEDLDKEGIDFLIIKIPKTLSLLEDQLRNLAPKLHAKSVVIAGSMVKHMHRSTIELFERIIGKTQTSLAKKKARLLFCQPDMDLIKGVTKFRPKVVSSYEGGPDMVNYANVFSREKFDIGTRFFIDNFKRIKIEKEKPKVIDLGCGNGILGIVYQAQKEDASIYFIDESYMAIRSAKESYNKAFSGKPLESKAEFIIANGVYQDEMKSISEKVDLVLCNPPFHNQHEIGSQTAHQMFKDAHDCLDKKGELWVVANSHLGYQVNLKTLFFGVRKVVANKKFVIYRATKPKPLNRV